MNVHGRWERADDDESVIAWAREFFDAAAPFASGGSYVNFMTGDETDCVAAAYGANDPRLQAIKRKYDPQNVFHVNHNIRP
jgi:FAD/FMN-containing dehydrogenase